MRSILDNSDMDFIPLEKRKRIFIYFARQFLKRICINYYDVQIYSKYNQKIWLRLNVQFSSLKCKLCERKQQVLAGVEELVSASHDCSFNEIIIV